MMGRISHVEGQLLRYIPAEKDWVAIVKDVPFGDNDALYSDENSRAEFIMPNNTWVRTDGSTRIQTIKLAEDTTEMDVASGETRATNKSSTALIKATLPSASWWQDLISLSICTWAINPWKWLPWKAKWIMCIPAAPRSMK